MKTLVEIWFDKFLDLMEPAWTELELSDFEKLEDKIINEISYRRTNESIRAKA